MSSKATRNNLVAIAALACMLPVAAQAAWDTHAPEKAFTYRGNPIDPRCVSVLTSWKADAPTQVDLANCTKPGVVKLEDREFSITSEGNALGSSWDAYEVLARDGSRFAVSSHTTEGGSLPDGYLKILQKRGATLIADQTLFPGKLSCSRFLPSVKVHGHRLTWTETFTPYELLGLGGLTFSKADMDPSAGGCQVWRELEYDLDSGTTRTTFVWLDILREGAEHGGPIRNEQGSTDRFTYQRCFNDYFDGLVAKGDTDFDADGIKRFADGLASACLAKKP